MQKSIILLSNLIPPKKLSSSKEDLIEILVPSISKIEISKLPPPKSKTKTFLLSELLFITEGERESFIFCSFVPKS